MHSKVKSNPWGHCDLQQKKSKKKKIITTHQDMMDLRGFQNDSKVHPISIPLNKDSFTIRGVIIMSSFLKREESTVNLVSNIQNMSNLESLMMCF